MIARARSAAVATPLALLAAASLAGCLDIFEGLWFTPEKVDEYVWPAHNEVPAEYVELVELEGTAVGEEEEAPTIFGVWVHQCLDVADESSCFSNDHEEFDAARRDTTILYFHGQGNELGHFWDRIQILWRMGFRVLAVDYRGYGRSTGEPSEDGLYADGRTALAHALERRADEDPGLLGPDGELPSPYAAGLVYYGFSLGTTVAVDVAVTDAPRVLVTEAALASAQGFVDDAASLGFSSTVLMDARFDNVWKIPFVTSPKLIMHGLDDTFVRFEFSQSLFDAAEEPKRLYAVDGAEHGTVPCPSRDTEAEPEDVPCVAEPPYHEALGNWIGEHTTSG